MFTYCFNNEFIFVPLLCILYFYDDERCKMNFPVRDNKVLLYFTFLTCSAASVAGVSGGGRDARGTRPCQLHPPTATPSPLHVPARTPLSHNALRHQPLRVQSRRSQVWRVTGEMMCASRCCLG